jgi:aldose 1-epimerase
MNRRAAHQTPVSGRQYTIRTNAYTATIASVGASLRVLQHRDRDLVVPYEADQLRPVYRGAILAPWPNRVVDGRYAYDGITHQLALTEPDRGHALHGLVVWQDFAVKQTGPERVALETQLPAQQGYPHQIEVAVTYEVDEHGLVTTVTGTNVGASTAPWGTAPHPYLVAGEGRVDDWSLQLPAHSILTVTPDRLAPVALGEVSTTAGGRFDFRIDRSLDGIKIDHAFTHLARDGDGVTTVRLRDSSGQGVAMTFDAACPWVQIHTADRPEPSLNRLGLAVEPMTCAPDAFNSGAGLIHLAPGESHHATWRIQAVSPGDAP